MYIPNRLCIIRRYFFAFLFDSRNALSFFNVVMLMYVLFIAFWYGFGKTRYALFTVSAIDNCERMSMGTSKVASENAVSVFMATGETTGASAVANTSNETCPIITCFPNTVAVISVATVPVPNSKVG